MDIKGQIEKTDTGGNSPEEKTYENVSCPHKIGRNEERTKRSFLTENRTLYAI